MKTPPGGYTTIPFDTNYLHNKKIGIIGFGNQAQPWALNLFDSGLEVYVGLRVGSGKAVEVLRNLVEVLQPERVAKMCDVICLLIPDEIIPAVLEEDIFPNAKDGCTIVLAHSYALFANKIKLPANMNCVLLAPHGPGEEVREHYQSGNGMPAQWDIIRDYSGDAERTVHALASALGFASGGLRRIEYRDEAIIDLFSEQAVLVGGLLAIISEALEALRDAGYDRAVSLVSCVNEIKGTADLFADAGLTDGLKKVSTVAAYGAFKTMEKLKEPLAAAFKQLLREIESGGFIKEFNEASGKGFPEMDELKERFTGLTEL